MVEVSRLELRSLRPNAKQNRTSFDNEKLQELANSIKEKGVLQPILVRRIGPDGFEIIAGERRFRAAKMAGLTHIPAIVKDSDDTSSMVDAFLENAQREDLTPSEKESALISLWRTGQFRTPKDLDKVLGYSPGYSGSIIEAREFREKYEIPISITTSTIVSTKGLSDELRRKLLLRVSQDEGRFGQVRTVRELKAIAERAPPKIADQVIDGTISVDEAHKAVDLFRQTSQQEMFRPLADAIAQGQVPSNVAERTLALYSKLVTEGAVLDQEVVSRDIEEVKRQSDLNQVHEKLVEQARMAVLTGKKKSTEFGVVDPGDTFLREVSDIAWKIQRWGVQNLMQVGAERWKVATNYFRDIENKMMFLLGQQNTD